MPNEPAISNSQTSSGLSPSLVDRKPLRIIIISGIVILLFFGVIIYLLGINDVTTATIRDIAIILLVVLTILTSFISLVLVLLLAYLILKINDLIELLNTEVRPLIGNLNHTVGTTTETLQRVQKRVAFVSDEAVKPVVKVVSSVHAVKTIMTTLFKR